jgi:hypothetical protein
VGDEDGGPSRLGTDLTQILLQAFAGQRVQSREGFVEQERRRLSGQRPGDRHPLLLATADLPDLAVGRALQPDPVQYRRSALRP